MGETLDYLESTFPNDPEQWSGSDDDITEFVIFLHDLPDVSDMFTPINDTISKAFEEDDFPRLSAIMIQLRELLSKMYELIESYADDEPPN